MVIETMTNLWIQTQIGSIPNEFWYVDYIEHIVSKSNKRPKYQSVRKWNGTIESFLDGKNIKYVKKNENIIKFENNS